MARAGHSRSSHILDDICSLCSSRRSIFAFISSQQISAAATKATGLVHLIRCVVLRIVFRHDVLIPGKIRIDLEILMFFKSM